MQQLQQDPSLVTKVRAYNEYLKNGLPWSDKKRSEGKVNLDGFLKVFKGLAISNLTIKRSFALEQEMFDLLIIDEASQCDMASVLPLIYRAKRVCILGDPLQLKHITSIDRGEQYYIVDELNLPVLQFDYQGDSLFDKMNTLAQENGYQSVFLNMHYRCHPEIVQFSNEHFYQRLAGQSLDIQTKPSWFTHGLLGLHWIEVKGTLAQDKNVNMEEVAKCIEMAKYFRKKYPKATIGIATPFKDQKIALQRGFQGFSDQQRENIIVDTVHRFQGDERDIMIFSLVVCSNGKDSLHKFINYNAPYLLNVGVTRAKSTLFIVGDLQYCRSLTTEEGTPTLLCELARYADFLNHNREESKKNDTSSLADTLVDTSTCNVQDQSEFDTLDVFETLEFCIENNKAMTIQYRDFHSNISSRKISQIAFFDLPKQELSNKREDHIKVFCHLKNVERRFKVKNIEKFSIEQ